MKILIDMNLSPAWEAGFDCVHWSTVGNPRASDGELMSWARMHGHVVFTHDMDFGALLAATRANGPSVLQARIKNTLPSSLGADVVRVLHFRREALERGALVTIDKVNSRVRVLPIGANRDSDDELA